MSENENLPPGWLELEFGDLFSRPVDDIVDGPFGSNLKASEYASAGIPIARLQNIGRNRFITKNIQYVTDEKAEELARHTFVPSDILITKLGAPLGKACLAPDSIPRGVLVADVVRARLTHPWVDRHFLCYQINAENVVEQFKEQTKGTTRPRVNLTKIRTLKVRLCPLPEQTLIVAKLEELISELDAGVAELNAAQKKLARYRQTLLKAAVEGVLTADWRAKHKPTETGAQLLARILTERRARWEVKQLARFEEQGKIPPKDWQNKYPEPVQPGIADLPKLPKGWVWASVDQCSLNESAITDGPFGSNLKSSHYQEHGPRVIRLQNIGDGEFVDAKAHISQEHYERLTKHAVEAGDLVVAMLGEELPRACIIPPGVSPAIVKADCARVRLNPALGIPHLVMSQLNSKPVRDAVLRFVKGIGRPRVNLGHIRAVPLAICSMEEQREIERALVEAGISIEDQLAAIDLALKQSTAQRQNILRAAFAGELVPQDPRDERASVLLERIRAERAERAQQPKIRKTKPKETAAMAIQLIDVLAEAGDWVPAQEVFRRCGVTDGALTERIEELYADLRELDKEGRLAVETVTDEHGRKLYDKLKLLAG
ncbi:type I restriction enzyme EcoEI specificity protein [Acidovorax sp. SUPP1855]|uniref:restriction endonuclease subunit S n=1 Tax=Acidovorax sp. SUPP1855 TaxID=431774 RepID=UPI0023DE5834|nr:restriction endonuclease subunit S [Acidovorax sp. SUPP1855]GKS86096.1 type I restriction enzyme EcoEI specificity protein [Acidovorax sp. SUPP1855]